MRPIDRNALTWIVCVLVGIFVAGLAVASASDKPDPPVSPAAKAARKKFDAAVARANEVHRLAVLAATRTYVKELEAALRAAANSGKTEEVTRIAAELEQAKQDMAQDERGPAAKPKTGRVLSTGIWQPVLRVKKGQVLQITAAGTWNVTPELECGPDGLRGHWVHNNKPSGLLIARIGRRTFDVGLEAEITVPATGVLEMSCNGGDASQEDDDYLDVTIVVGTGRPADTKDGE